MRVDVEPALGLVRDKFVGGLRLPGDETGDCFKFTAALGQMAAARGVEFRYDTTIHGLLAMQQADRLDATQSDFERFSGASSSAPEPELPSSGEKVDVPRLKGPIRG